MQKIDFKRFIFENKIKQSLLAKYLGVSEGYISSVASGRKELSSENLGKVLNNPHGWDVSMLLPESNGLHEPTLQGREKEVSSNDVRSAVESILKPTESDGLVDYLKQKVEDQDALIRELYQQIGMLEAKLELARKGETANAVGGSLSADAV